MGILDMVVNIFKIGLTEGTSDQKMCSDHVINDVPLVTHGLGASCKTFWACIGFMIQNRMARLKNFARTGSSKPWIKHNLSPLFQVIEVLGAINYVVTMALICLKLRHQIFLN